jgi:hypothetical protein
LILGTIVFIFGGRIVVATPDPIHSALAVIFCLIEIARGTRGVVHNGTWLQTIRQDDIGIHGTDIEVVDIGLLNALGPIAEHFQFLNNLTTNL